LFDKYYEEKCARFYEVPAHFNFIFDQNITVDSDFDHSNLEITLGLIFSFTTEIIFYTFFCIFLNYYVRFPLIPGCLPINFYFNGMKLGENLSFTEVLLC
jgi:hypothetical protein